MMKNVSNLSGGRSGLPENWDQMTAGQKRAWRLQLFASGEGVKFVSQAAQQAYQLRAKRLVDVFNVREPDRVPVNLPVGDLPYILHGIDMRTVMYDYDKVVSACKAFNAKYSDELEHYAAPYATPGKVLELLDYKLYAWPGHGLAANAPGIQFIEGEYMKAEEYEALIDDPSDFWTRNYLPRIFGAFQPFSMLSPVTDMVEIINVGQLASLSTSQAQETLQLLIDAGKEYQKMFKAQEKFGASPAANGFPPTFGAFCKAPFDILGDSLRGTQAIMKDMYRRPEQLLAALDVIANITIRSMLNSPHFSKTFMVNYPLHKGADGWMSQKQFDTFYWPSLKKVMKAFINEGMIQSMFAEGGFNTRLESVNEFDKGAVTWLFDQSDMVKAKQVLGNKCCIQGNVPSSLIVTGDPKDVKEYCRKLIEVCGKGGGFILAAGAISEKPKLDNLRSMLAAAKEYGVYRK
jgi:uroporphyrinogen-III decarboxylase